jgi:hypothetical protein
MTNSKPLSPAAQAVLDAAFPVYDDEHLYVATGEQHAGMIAAAALRAIATGPLVYQLDDEMMRTVLVVDADDLLAIADELEGFN